MRLTVALHTLRTLGISLVLRLAFLRVLGVDLVNFWIGVISGRREWKRKKHTSPADYWVAPTSNRICGGIGHRCPPSRWRSGPILTVTLWRLWGTALSILILDLDRFKAINDIHGHSAGEWVLTAVAHEFTRQMSSSDAQRASEPRSLRSCCLTPR